MDRLACPLCGSEYFVSSTGLDKRVFHLSTQGAVELVPATSDGKERLNLELFYCGACSWSGAAISLVPSQM